MGDTDNVGLGVGIKRDGSSVVGISLPTISGSSSAQYPYDCASSHCPLDADSCDNMRCSNRITSRTRELAAVVQDLENETKSLQEELKRLAELAWERWEDKIELQTATEIEGIGYFHSSHDCPGCTVETFRRKTQAGRLMTALLREKLRTIKEHVELREREEAQEQDRLRPLEERESALNSSAPEDLRQPESLDEYGDHKESDAETGEIETLSGKFSRLQEPADSPEPPASENLHHVESLDEDCEREESGAETGEMVTLPEASSNLQEPADSPESSPPLRPAFQDTLPQLRGKKKWVPLEDAFEFGGTPKKKPKGVVRKTRKEPGSLTFEQWRRIFLKTRNGSGSLNFERERTRHQAAESTQLFGRVGSYRGHGASALKTRERQMNPQTKGGKK